MDRSSPTSYGPRPLPCSRNTDGNGELALTNEEGKPLVRYWLDETGKMKRYDCINAAWRRIAAQVGPYENATRP